MNREFPPILVALGVVVAGVIAGVVLLALGFTFVGIVVALAALPVGFVAWIMAGD
jgi:hypothetical protein